MVRNVILKQYKNISLQANIANSIYMSILQPLEVYEKMIQVYLSVCQMNFPVHLLTIFKK